MQALNEPLHNRCKIAPSTDNVSWQRSNAISPTEPEVTKLAPTVRFAPKKSYKTAVPNAGWIAFIERSPWLFKDMPSQGSVPQISMHMFIVAYYF